MKDLEFQYIIERIVDNAKDAFDDAKANRNDYFNLGKSLAYYEVLDIIKNELIVRDIDLADYKLDIDLERLI
ncbi:MAG: transposase [Clostridia bacterium]|nr:transposase [Clostridia bacterium]